MAPSSPPVPPSPNTHKPAAAGVRDTTAVTADLAVLQENEGLRLALREQERIVEELTNECRRLEDRLEDRYQDIDALRRELDRKDRVLKDAEGRGFIAGGAEVATAPAANHAAPAPPAFDPDAETSDHPGRLRFVGGFATGLVIASVAGGGLWWSGVLPPAPFIQTHTASVPLIDETTLANHFNPLAPLVGEPYLVNPPAGGAGVVPVTNAPPPADVPPLPEDTALAQSIPLPSPAEAVAGAMRDQGGPEMVAIRPARFAMGDPIGMSDSDARPVRAVQLDGYLIGVDEVTFNEYDRFVRATGARRPNDFGWGRGTRPVVDVSWDEVQSYLRWLSQQTGQPYRLPTEAEWEYAARSGSASSYWWGAGSAENRAVCFDCGTRWDRLSTAPVGSFAANPFGLHDTAGNVYEWVADCYRPTYQAAPATGAAVDAPDCQQRVVRGGSFNSPSSAMRSHARNRFAATTHVDMIGFRVARSNGR